MKVQCPGCRSTIAIPDEKVPEGKSIRVLCPKCKNPIQVSRNQEREQQEQKEEFQIDLNKDGQEPVAPTLTTPPPPVQPVSQEASKTSRSMAQDFQYLDMVEEGVEKALLCVSDASQRQKIEQALQQMDFYISNAGNVQQAIVKLSNNSYDMVIVDEDYRVTQDEDEESLSQFIESLPMYTRRMFLLCLVSDKLRTLDQLASFRFGVNLILNTQDLEKARMIFERAIRDYKNLYRAYTSESKKRE